MVYVNASAEDIANALVKDSFTRFGVYQCFSDSENELLDILVQRLRMQELAELVQSNMAKSAYIQEST